MPIKKLAAASNKNHPQPSIGLTWNAITVASPAWIRSIVSEQSGQRFEAGGGSKRQEEPDDSEQNAPKDL